MVLPLRTAKKETRRHLDPSAAYLKHEGDDVQRELFDEDLHQSKHLRLGARQDGSAQIQVQRLRVLLEKRRVQDSL